MYIGTKPYGLEGLIEHHGDGSNLYRGENFGQPRTLVPGDVLANGLEVASSWSEEGNGGIALDFTDGTKRVVPARIPLLLAGGVSGEYPFDMRAGDIFETGDVVLAKPTEFSPEDPIYEKDRREVELLISGGLSGHSVAVPKDIVIALHDEAYPPSIEKAFGAFVVEQTLKMGAKARKNLPDYGRLDKFPESARVASVFEEITNARRIASREYATYLRTIDRLTALCEGLKGVELLITGRLHGRGGTRVYEDDPRSLVENLLIEVSSARVNTYGVSGGSLPGDRPFIELVGWTEDRDLLVAWLDVEKFGVTAKFPNGPSK